MAIQQAYRGNPSVKQYQLTQNFIGGLNTKEADDVVTDIEFRELLNADLGNQGIITNRKGFKDLIVFNSMMEIAVDSEGDPAGFPEGTFRLAKVAKDTSNIVNRIADFDSLADFRTALQSTAYELVIIFQVDADFYRLKVTKAAGVLNESVQFDHLYNIPTVDGGDSLPEFKSKISVPNVEFLDSIYILPGNSYVYEYKILEDTFDKLAPYAPTPFDVKYVGFNVLADNPLTYIVDQGISNKSIEGVFLTIDDNKPVQQIPGGVFEINVIHTGTGFTTDEVGIRFFIDFETADEVEIFPLLIEAKDLGGLFVFKYNAVGLSNYAGKEITIKLFELDQSTGSDLTANVSNANKVDLGDGTFETTINVVDSSIFVVENSYFLIQPSLYQLVRIKEVVDATSIKIYGQVTGTYTTAAGARLIAGTEKTSGLTFDPFLDSYTIIGAFSTLPQAVENLDLAGFRMLEINYRMVYYGGKVIWFSDLYQFNYVPNYNFISLPLGTTDEIQRIVFFRGSYIIFTKDEIYRMSGTFGAADFRIDSVNKFVGCIAPNSVRNVGNELFFLTRDGLYKLKSSVFQDNLENVEKIDKAISDDVQISEYVDSILYNEQYILYYNEGEPYDTLRMYYEIDLGRARNPFVRDIFTGKPELIVREEGELFALRDGRWFIYDRGYTDFMPAGTENTAPFTYRCVIEAPSLSMRFPTHEKKFKNIFIKALHGEKIVPLFITIKVDGYDVLTPSTSAATVNAFGEVVYDAVIDPNVSLISSAFLGELELGLTPLGEITQQLHKLSFSGKGKNIKLIIEQQIDSSFGIIDIGYLFKLGKVKE
jgi:hypothetical protein